MILGKCDVDALLLNNLVALTEGVGHVLGLVLGPAVLLGVVDVAAVPPHPGNRHSHVPSYIFLYSLGRVATTIDFLSVVPFVHRSYRMFIRYCVFFSFKML